MDFLETPSRASLWRGYDYFKEGGHVSHLADQGDGIIAAEVQGTRPEPYHVRVDVAHPRRSTCDCPHAAGKHLVCKHMVAAYFTRFPEMEQELMRRVEEAERAEERYREERREEIRRMVWAMKKDELREALLCRMVDEEERRDRWW